MLSMAWIASVVDLTTPWVIVGSLVVAAAPTPQVGSSQPDARRPTH
jgi:hypothetical protein